MIITEIQYFFSKIIRFQAIFKDTVEFTCALEFKISSQPAAAYRINCFAIHAISAGLRHIRDIKNTRPLKQAWRSGTLHIHVYIFENRSALQSTCFALMIFSINTHKKQMPHPKVWRLFFLWVFTSFRPCLRRRRALRGCLL